MSALVVYTLQFIKEQVHDWFGISSDPLTQELVPSDMKDTLKSLLNEYDL